MKVNGKEYNLNDLIQDVDFKSNMLRKVNNNLDLTNYQIEVLKRFDISCETASSLNEIIYEATEAYEDTLDEELDVVLSELCERNYYENTNK